MYTVWNVHFCFIAEFGVHNRHTSFCASLNYRAVLLVNTPLAQKQEHYFQSSPVLNILCTKDAFLRTRYQLKTLLYRFSDMLAPFAGGSCGTCRKQSEICIIKQNWLIYRRDKCLLTLIKHFPINYLPSFW